jgi:hypothetical protein
MIGRRENRRTSSSARRAKGWAAVSAKTESMKSTPARLNTSGQSCTAFWESAIFTEEVFPLSLADRSTNVNGSLRRAPLSGQRKPAGKRS